MAKDTGTVNIHGKEYKTVAARVQQFREQHMQNFSIVTEIVERTADDVVMKASIISFEGNVVIATGYAEEKRSSSQINRTSALENAETSAIGRALAAFGMAGTEYASADEVAQAIHQQSQPPIGKSDSPDEVLKRAKGKINDELEAQNYTTAPAKKAFIVKVLGHSTIDNLNEADLVMDALENEQEAA